jgi:hypothetical protein
MLKLIQHLLTQPIASPLTRSSRLIFVLFLWPKLPTSLPHALAVIYGEYSAITATVAASQRH